MAIPLGRSQAVTSRTAPASAQARMIHRTFVPLVPTFRTIVGEIRVVSMVPAVRATAYQPASPSVSPRLMRAWGMKMMLVSIPSIMPMLHRATNQRPLFRRTVRMLSLKAARSSSSSGASSEAAAAPPFFSVRNRTHRTRTTTASTAAKRKAAWVVGNWGAVPLPRALPILEKHSTSPIMAVTLEEGNQAPATLGVLAFTKEALKPSRSMEMNRNQYPEVKARRMMPPTVMKMETRITLTPKRSMSRPERKLRMIPARRGAVAILPYWPWLRPISVRSRSARLVT